MFSKWVIFILSRTKQFPTLPELVLSWLPCSTSVIKTKRVQPERRVMQAQTQSQPWTPPESKGSLNGDGQKQNTVLVWGLSGRKNHLLMENKYSSASDDPNNRLPYWLSPDYAWGPQRNNRAWQAKKCFVVGTQWILKNEWSNEWMNKWTEHPFFPGWQCSFCSSEGICQPTALWSVSLTYWK